MCIYYWLNFKIMTKNPIRIIPILDIKNGLLIKGINLEGLRILGIAENFSKYYYENGADEICYIDNVATFIWNQQFIKIHKEISKRYLCSFISWGRDKKS